MIIKCCVCDKHENTMNSTLDSVFCDRCYRELKRRMKNVALKDTKMPYGTTNNIRQLVSFAGWMYGPKEDTINNNGDTSRR